MGTLTTIAEIRAVDRLSGPLAAMASRVGSIHGRFKRAGDAMSNAAGRAAASTGIVGYGLANVVRQASEANDALAAMGMATLFDNMREDPTAAVTKTLAQMEIASGKVEEMSEGLGVTPGKIARISKALKQAGTDVAILDDAARAVGLAIMADPDADIEAVAKYSKGVLGLAKSYDKLGKSTEVDFVKNAVGGAAAVGLATPWGAGEFIKAKSDQMALSFATGLSSEQQDAFLGSAAAANQQPDVASTTMRSNIQRILSPTPMQMAAWRDSGLKRSQFVNSGSMDTTRTLQALRNMGMGRLDAKELRSIERDLSAAKLSGVADTDEFATKMQNRLGKMLGLDMSMEENVAKSAEMWTEAATAGGMKVDLEGFFRAIAAKGEQGAALLPALLERQRASTNLAFLSAFIPDEAGRLTFDEMLAISKSGAAGMEAGLEYYMKSSNTVGKRLDAAWELMNFRLANSPVMLSGLQHLNAAMGLVNRTAKEHPELANYAAGLGMMALAVPPLRLLGASAKWAGLGMAGLVGAVSRASALPFAAGAAGLAKYAKGAGDAALKAVMLGQSFKGLQMMSKAGGFGAGLLGFLGKVARFAGPLGIVAGGLAVFQNWDNISGFFGEIGKSQEFADAAAALDRLGKAAAPIGQAIQDAFKWLTSLLGIDSAGSLFMQGATGLLATFTTVANGITAAINAAKGAKDWLDQLGGGDAAVPPGEPVGMPKGMSRGGLIPSAAPDPWANPTIATEAPPQIDIGPSISAAFQPIQQTGDELSGSAQGLNGAASALNAAASSISAAAGRLQTPTIINSGGVTTTGGAPKAGAPAPRTSNGPQHNGKG